MGQERVSRGQPRPRPKGRIPGSPNFGAFYMRAHSVRNNNHILRGDQTRYEETFYTVDHEC